MDLQREVIVAAVAGLPTRPRMLQAAGNSSVGAQGLVPDHSLWLPTASSQPGGQELSVQVKPCAFP